MEFKELAAAQQAAKQGNTDAQCCLGDFYATGQGVLMYRTLSGKRINNTV